MSSDSTAIFNMEPDGIKDAGVIMTIVGGMVVYLR
jgi:predicted amidohydrolase YtcJ